MRIEQVAWEDPVAEALRAGQRAEIAEMYGAPDSESRTPPSAADIAVFLVARDESGPPVGCGGLRDLGNQTGEVKRMYVVPEARGACVTDRDPARPRVVGPERGWTALRLETGDRQPAAVRFYERSGYRRIPNFGAYAGVEGLWYFERPLVPGKVLAGGVMAAPECRHDEFGAPARP